MGRRIESIKIKIKEERAYRCYDTTEAVRSVLTLRITGGLSVSVL
jgi:hypothetical protein